MLTILVFAVMNLNAQSMKEIQANQAMEEGDYRAANELLTKTIESGNPTYKTYFRRAMSFVYMQEPQKAVADLDKTVELNPDYADAYNLRGLVLSAKPDYEAAIKDYSKAIELDPEFGAPYVNRAVAYINLDQKEKALIDLHTAEKYWQDNPEIYYNRGNIYKEKGKYDEAIRDYTLTIKYGIDDKDIRYKRANCHFLQEDYEKAIADYTKALEYAPGSTDCLNNRAVSYDRVGRVMEANADRATLQKIIDEIRPPIEKINFVTRFSDENTFRIDLPEGWEMQKDGDSYIIIGNPDAGGQPGVMGRIFYSLNFADGKGFKNPQEMIIWWDEFIKKSGDNYKHYHFRIRKDKPYKAKYPSKYNISEVHVAGGNVYFHYDYAIAYGKHLFHLNAQVLMKESDYYDDIIEKIAKSISLLNDPE